MKKMISLIIALVLVISLIPATFAAETSLAKKTITFDTENVTKTLATEDDMHCILTDGANSFKLTWQNDDTYFVPVENPMKVTFADGSATPVEFLDGTEGQAGIKLATATNNRNLVIKTKTPKAGRATYKISYVWGHSNRSSSVTSSFNGTSLGALSSKSDSISISSSNPYVLETKTFDTLVYTEPDADGYLKIEMTASQNAVNIVLYQIIIEEVETEKVTFDLSAATTAAVACADQTEAGANEYFSKISGYMQYSGGNDIIIHNSTEALVAGFEDRYVYDGSTKLDGATRFNVKTRSSANGYLYMRVKVPEGIWQLDVTTGKHASCGRVRVYIEDKYVGEINDYDSTMTSVNASVNETSLVPVKVTPDSDGYITIRFSQLEVLNGSSLEFIPFKFEFNNASDAAAYRDVESVSVYADVKGEGGTITSAQIAEGIPANPEVGKLIALKAVPEDGYKFAYWSDSAGRVVHYDAEYSFNAYTNKVVYANFDKKDDASKTGVEFFDGNHDFLGFVEDDGDDVTFADYKAKAPTPGMTGYTFVGWSVEDDAEINGVVRAVAQYEDDGIVVGDIAITDAETVENAKYGQLIDVNVNGERNSWQWLRDNKMVAYGENFSFYAFAPATITYSTTPMGEQSPLVVIDELDGGAYMLEYTEGAGEILEAGIIFGNETKKSVSACYYKATVKDLKEGHGQFTAKKSTVDANLQTVVRGYIIYRFGDDICVKYAELD